VLTNAFDAEGGFSVTGAVSPGMARQVYRLEAAHPFGPVGFATVNGGITGGDGGITQTVTTVSALISAAGAAAPRVIRVDGVLDIDGNGTGRLDVNSNKTLLGVGTNAWIRGQVEIDGVTNVIVRNLSFTNDGAPSVLDGIRIFDGAHHVWVDHCTFVDCSDGELDITVGSDYVTVSWCKFHYTRDNGHNFVNLIAGSDLDAGDYRITFHHNWWSTGCKQRMPMSRYGTVHLFNNYYFAPGNQYCANARTNAQFLSEHNYYREVDDPIYAESNGRIRTVGNIYQACTGRIDAGLDRVDAELRPPPYGYTLDPAVDVPAMVTEGAGVGRGPFAP
jgi:pectate lyase